jgi:hypothetical protein
MRVEIPVVTNDGVQTLKPTNAPPVGKVKNSRNLERVSTRNGEPTHIGETRRNIANHRHPRARNPSRCQTAPYDRDGGLLTSTGPSSSTSGRRTAVHPPRSTIADPSPTNPTRRVQVGDGGHEIPVEILQGATVVGGAEADPAHDGLDRGLHRVRPNARGLSPFNAAGAALAVVGCPRTSRRSSSGS